MKPPIYPKKISVTETIYYHYKISPISYALFDSELNTPVSYGSYNFVNSTISNLPPSVTIFYFEIDRKTGWRMKRSYNPKKEAVETDELKKSVEKSEANKKI